VSGGLSGWLRRAWDSPPGPAPPAAWLLEPLSFLYGTALALRPSVRARPALIPVVSVGSIWSGGAGKTPLAATLARIAREEKIDAAIVLRGYRGEIRHGVGRVPARPEPGDAVRFGDEACLHARRGDATVYVAADRLAAAQRAAEEGKALVILDDGMQHRGLARDLEIVSLPGHRPIGNGRLLPRGPLREGPGALSRADVLILAHAPLDGSAHTREPRFVALRAGVPIFSWRDRLSFRPMTRIPATTADPVPAGEPGSIPPPGARVAVLCGIARPEPFRIAVRDAGFEVAWCESFPDHHPFTPMEIAALRARASGDRIPWIVTTEKDEMRIAGIAGAGAPTMLVAELSLDWNEPEAERTLREHLRRITARAR